MNIAIPDWTRAFVTATIENSNGETITQHTGWRAVLDPACLDRYPSCNEVDLAIVADDALHGPGECGTDCHNEGNASNLCCMSVPAGSESEQTFAARTALAEQGFRLDGPWVPGTNGTLTALLVPVILDPACAAFEPEAAAAAGIVAKFATITSRLGTHADTICHFTQADAEFAAREAIKSGAVDSAAVWHGNAAVSYFGSGR